MSNENEKPEGGNALVEVALAYQNNEIDSEELRWLLTSEKQRKHIESVYEVEVKPQQIATILINDWEPVRLRYELEHFDVPAWLVRDCINQYVTDIVSKANMIVLFEHFAERQAKLQAHTVEELAAMVMEQNT